MAKTILYGLPSLASQGLGRQIRAADWQAVARSQNALFGTRGVTLGGRGRSGTTRLLYVTGTDWTQAAASDSLAPTALRDWSAVMRGYRYINDSDTLQLEIDWYAQHLDLRLSVVDVLAGTTTLSQILTGSATEEWQRDTIGLTLAEAQTAGVDRALAVYLEMRRRASDTEGSLWAWRVRERVLRAGDEALLP